MGEAGASERECAASGTMLTRNHQDLFATALIAYLPRLRRYATALAGSVSVADDLVQDCMERALKRAETLQDPQRMAGWLRSILLHLYMDMVRLQRSRGTGVEITQVDNDLALSVPPADRGATIDFIRALDGLSAEHRQILLLVGLEGLNYREIAEELGIPMGTVMSRLARARERLRNALDKEQNLNSAEQQPSVRRLER
jgi:RNA polymerase sigma-70 factor (ECF subfamily)